MNDIVILELFDAKGYKQRVEIIQKDSDNISVDLSKYFMSSHKVCRKLNKVMFDKFSGSTEPSLYISLLKLADKDLFECCRLLEVVKYYKSKNKNILIKTGRRDLLEDIIDLLKVDLDGVKIESVKSKKSIIKHVFGKLVKLSIFCLNRFRVKSYTTQKIFFLYDGKISFEYAKPYLNNCITYPFLTGKNSYKNICYDQDYFINYKFVCHELMIKSFKRFRQNRKSILNTSTPIALKKLLIHHLSELEIQVLCFESLTIKFDSLENILGLFDAYPCIDYVTKVLNDEFGVRTTCIPHGVNFKYKVHYISYGTNIYSFWSNDHKNRLAQSVIYNNSADKIITGNVLFSSMSNETKPENINDKSILVVGEYFSIDGLYSSPFNEEHTRRMMFTLKKFVLDNLDVTIKIRTRLNDEYAQICAEYQCDNITIVSPEVSIEEEIMSSSLIISVFSNVLHEALIMRKPVLQVNMLGIENYRDLASDGLVNYATDEGELYLALRNWKIGNLKRIDYELHERKYCNRLIFKPIKLMV
ncbi:hypothetical protein PVK64_07290 [Aliivibrio sp. S4TY2]|uniref:hypothetical protein n=1 Tax=unclassified Aliivibrio TaxID=2645654 RepID=UPI00237834E8|nr:MULTISPECIES: hypothetical protein [unclassified Aliivibrio]MDD9155983.1 hypothetical protein [Aliivibrio sp. S4TY2]MDD9159692.1 hypothetical protein [Aliivibrio sp. S4TY1]MDD9163692.1 hypothetical protein [Aliivibrio sp. S4MY2]MDD9167692.1 hypothetical protein [Aliivibrio sp. S4MY4]MDD9185644.1 hypothetical protein [Aliivibrio sp. S4MY3]